VRANATAATEESFLSVTYYSSSLVRTGATTDAAAEYQPNKSASLTCGPTRKEANRLLETPAWKASQFEAAEADFELTFTPAAGKGQDVVSTLTASTSGGFDGGIILRVVEAPAGMNVRLDSAAIVPGIPVVLRATVPTSTKAGSYFAVIEASGASGEGKTKRYRATWDVR
jgi:hypothetical protein